jgi:DNA repair photolyase
LLWQRQVDLGDDGGEKDIANINLALYHPPPSGRTPQSPDQGTQATTIYVGLAFRDDFRYQTRHVQGILPQAGAILRLQRDQQTSPPARTTMAQSKLSSAVTGKLMSMVRHVEPLTDEEAALLVTQEEVIGKELQAFFKVGAALLIIRKQALYRKEYDTFAEYCEKRWDMTSRRMRQITDGTEVCNTLREYDDDRNHGSPFGGRLPENERQVRPLTRLRDKPKQLASAWGRALSGVPEGKVTCNVVRDAVKAEGAEGTKPEKQYTIHKDLAHGKELLKQAKQELGAHFEYFADQISALPMDLLDKAIKGAGKAPKDGKAVFGTWEWADAEADCLMGCPHDCRYCYAKVSAIRSRKRSASDWQVAEAVELRMRGSSSSPKIVMFPTQHDITPEHLPACIDAIRQLLDMGSVEQVLIVSKPHLECIEAICSEFAAHKNRILFRFTIGSADDAVLSFWEPNAPSFKERLDCLKYAHEGGFRTSVSCEPMLDGDIDAVVSQVESLVSDAIWVGRGNLMRQRVGANCPKDEEALNRARQLVTLHDSQFIWDLYHDLEDNPKVKWKESIKKVVGLPIAVEAGTDE